MDFKDCRPCTIAWATKSQTQCLRKIGKDFDHDLKLSKATVEIDAEKENNLIKKEKETREETTKKEHKQAKAELQNHRQAMHPRYSFTGDNVDMQFLCSKLNSIA